MTYEEQRKVLEGFQKEMASLLEKKGNDYSNVDCLSNFKSTAQITQQKPESTVLTMIGIKVARLGVLLNAGKDVKNESIKDSILDLANYAFLLRCVIEDNQEVEPSKSEKLINGSPPTRPLFPPDRDVGDYLVKPHNLNQPMLKLNVNSMPFIGPEPEKGRDKK